MKRIYHPRGRFAELNTPDKRFDAIPETRDDNDRLKMPRSYGNFISYRDERTAAALRSNAPIDALSHRFFSLIEIKEACCNRNIALDGFASKAQHCAPKKLLAKWIYERIIEHTKRNRTNSMSDSSSGCNIGCGCLIMMIVVWFFLWSLWFGLPTPWGKLNIDIFPPRIWDMNK